jgi:multicomponent Na+:H+ antiporter subunit E
LLLTVIALFTTWVLFSARLDIYSLIIGFVGSIGIALATYKTFITERGIRKQRHIIPRLFQLFLASVVLVITLYSSSWRVMKAIITGKISPAILQIQTKLHTNAGRVFLANAITFTPGTATISLEDDVLTVHWLFGKGQTNSASSDSVKSPMEDKIMKVWP